MEYADSGDLLQVIKSRKEKNDHFPEEYVRKLIVSLVEGLNTLHYKKIFHRDLKVSTLYNLVSLLMSFSFQMVKQN